RLAQVRLLPRRRHRPPPHDGQKYAKIVEVHGGPRVSSAESSSSSASNAGLEQEYDEDEGEDGLLCAGCINPAPSMHWTPAPPFLYTAPDRTRQPTTF